MQLNRYFLANRSLRSFPVRPAQYQSAGRIVHWATRLGQANEIVAVFVDDISRIESFFIWRGIVLLPAPRNHTARYGDRKTDKQIQKLYFVWGTITAQRSVVFVDAYVTPIAQTNSGG